MSVSNINNEVYIAKSDIFDKINVPERFSFETDFMQPNIGLLNIGASICDEYFIDIGSPEDYKRAQVELSFYI